MTLGSSSTGALKISNATTPSRAQHSQFSVFFPTVNSFPFKWLNTSPIPASPCGENTLIPFPGEVTPPASLVSSPLVILHGMKSSFNSTKFQN